VTREEALPIIEKVQHLCIELMHKNNLPLLDLRDALAGRLHRIMSALEFEEDPYRRSELSRLSELIGAVEGLDRCVSYAKAILKRAIEPHSFVPHLAPESKCLICGLVWGIIYMSIAFFS
jgi:hypothetical protein